jgi:hypothetical protein
LPLFYGVVREDRERIIRGRGRVVMKGAIVISCSSWDSGRTTNKTFTGGAFVHSNAYGFSTNFTSAARHFMPEVMTV